MDTYENVAAKDFFETIVPQVFGGKLKSAPIQGMDGTEFTLQFNVTGAGGGNYGIVIKDGREMRVVSGGIPTPMITIELSENDWKDSITGKAAGVMDMFMEPTRTSRKQFDMLKGTRGMFTLNLTKDDGGVFVSKITFNGAETPSTTIKMKSADYAAMSAGKMKGPEAFMAGKMRIEGDMGFAMTLSRFIG